MPIKAENKDKYPKDWIQIRKRILEAAGNRCEWCNVENYAIGVRDNDGTFMTFDECESGGYPDNDNKAIKIVLTIAHLDHDPTNNRRKNLKALCQRCHNRHDIEHRKETRAEAKRKRDKELGQTFLFEGSDDA